MLWRVHSNLYRQLSLTNLNHRKQREIRQDITRTFPDLPVRHHVVT
jgi:hypothetical protein